MAALTTVHRPGWAFLLVPPLIMLVLPIVRRRAVAGDGTLRIAYTGGYVARVLTAFLLWALGLSLWISKLFQLSDEGQTILTGAYVGVAILSLGLIATLAVLPFRLRVVRVDVAGNVVGAGRPAVHAPAPEAIRSSAEHDE